MSSSIVRPFFDLAQLAERFGLELKGEGSVPLHTVCTLAPGKPGAIAFLANPKLREGLASTQASAVIVGRKDAAALRTGLIAPDPYVAFARIAALFEPHAPALGIHPTAVVAASARIGTGCSIGPHCVVGEDVVLGDACVLGARVYLHAGVRIGARCRFEPGAVIGSRGFGNAPSKEGWVTVPQLGSVRIGDDVEVGANTCIDRGAIEDTVIENGVKLDNLIQIAHNVHIGAHTAIAAGTGIAGSARIGARCMIGGLVGIAGHLSIADDCIVLARATVTHSLTTKGIYGGGLPADEARAWRKQVANVRRLDVLKKRIRVIENQLKIQTHDDDAD